ncbi:hypothetical protein [Oscillatoria salina]|uniref:hypothetical protein n=1 Tax=Oscillatoria salina TaxID=331517 RepID=UPI0013BAC06C|nr:hypothetical protein [Oscillatoria salina]MBZ8183001.1 hypothetical protein [Oscillatoria salina IIICB1]NET86638.1 hypothetical protein [Kamptonema sp. SIO1D9]
MIALKDFLSRELENLNEEQLQEIREFIAFLKFRDRKTNLTINEDKIASLYQESAEEDRQLAELGIDGYQELLKQAEEK